MRVIAGSMLLVILFLSSCVPGSESPVAETGRPDQQEGILLPAPRLSSERSLEETLSRRRSVRRFTDEELTTEDISQLLWAVQGITREWGGRARPPRPAPSIRLRFTSPCRRGSITTSHKATRLSL